MVETSHSTAEGTGLIPGWRAKIPHAATKKKNVLKKLYYYFSIHVK